MRCPVCGGKMINDGAICRYCSDVSIDRIKTSSNKLAKKAKKDNRKDEVVYSTYIPHDVSKVKLACFTIFLGFIGVHDFYVGKTLKGLYNLISITLTFVLLILKVLGEGNNWGVESGLQPILSVCYLLCAIAIILWFRDIINVLIKKYKIPVILGDKD